MPSANVELKKVRVLFVEPSSDLGGVSQYILKVVRHIASRYELFFGGPTGGTLLKENIFQQRVTSFPLDIASRNPFQIRRIVNDLRNIIQKNEITVVHAHTLRAGFFCALALKKSNVAFVYTPHGIRFLQKRNGISNFFLRWADRWVCGRADALVTLSDKEKAEAIRFHLKPRRVIVVIPTFIDVPEFSECAEGQMKKSMDSKIPQDAFVVGMVGRITEQKDPFGFLTIARAASLKNQNIFFVWVGDGELRGLFEERISKLALGNRIFLAGQADHEVVIAWMRRFDTFLFTSHYEGLPISLLEAFSVGVPVVASLVGSISDIVKEGETGWGFQDGDYGSAVRLMLASEHLSFGERNAMIEHQRALVVSRYSPEARIGTEYARLYEEVLKK